MTTENERLKTLCTAVLKADKGHLEMHQLLTSLADILKPTEPLLAVGVTMLAQALSARCQELLAVVIEVGTEVAAEEAAAQ